MNNKKNSRLILPFLLSLITLTSALAVNASVFPGAHNEVKPKQLDHNKRVQLLVKFQEQMGELGKGPAVEACIISAAEGDDDAVRALYIMAQSMKLIERRQDKLLELFNSNKTDREMYEEMGQEFNSETLGRVSQLTRLYPKAEAYCNSKLNTFEESMEEDSAKEQQKFKDPDDSGGKQGPSTADQGDHSEPYRGISLEDALR